jgi:ferredoxin
MKTAPLYRMLKQGYRKNAKFLAFEGVRAEESAKRSDYNRIGKGVKHSFVINARPILRWNTTEVFLYLFRHQLPINKAYRSGKPRVGCILCPFGSPWDDMIVNKCYPDNLQPFLSRIERVVEERKIPNKDEYISDRRWRLRGSGKFSQSTTSIQYISSSTRWEAKVKNSQKDVFTWLHTVGKYSISDRNNITTGELLFEKEVFQFEIRYGEKKSDFSFILYDNNNIQLRYYLRRVINKTSYCINCEACELECPTGALSVYPEVIINKELCTHCHKCLEYHNVGCIVADSMLKPTDTNISNMKISKYGTFGIHQEWVDQYLSSPSDFWSDNMLGVKQVPSFKAWLKDAEIIDDKNNLTPFGELCVEINKNSTTLLWELIYINLTYNSPLVRWYIKTFAHMADFSRKSLDKLAIEYFQQTFKETTITYAIQALMQSFKYSPIGEEFRQCIVQDEKGNSYRRDNYTDLSPEAIAYSIYRYAQYNDIKMFRVSDLYRSDESYGIYKEFGISKNDLMKSLRYLSSEKNRVLIAELNMGLDHITLREDLTSIAVLKALLD